MTAARPGCRPRRFPRNSFDQSSEPFFDLAIAPDDPDRLYANLSGPSVAISTDGGLNWALANGETEVFFGDACVIHILDSEPGTLYQGCEAPLDNAWVATQDIDPANPFALSNFTFVAGGPDFALENRRPNGLASGPARPGTLYAGLEGALIALDDRTSILSFARRRGRRIRPTSMSPRSGSIPKTPIISFSAEESVARTRNSRCSKPGITAKHCAGSACPRS